MIVKDLNQIQDKKFKVIIIGSGLAGISAALKFEKKKFEVLIVESGNLEFEENTLSFLKAESIGDHLGDFSQNRLRQFGGTSRIWGGNCNPMNEENFLEWPINKKDLDKYTNEAREFLLLKKEFFNEKLNDNLNIYNIVWSKLRIDEKIYEHIKNSKLIHLTLNSTFLTFESNGITKNITSIKCKKNNQDFSLKAKFFILACGGIENSRLLLWSRENNKSLFNKNLPIGKYYMHHPFHTIGSGLINYKKLNQYFKKNSIYNSLIVTCDNNIYIEANKLFSKNKKITNSGIYINFKEANFENNIYKQLRCFAPKFAKKIFDNIKSKEIYEINIETLQEQRSIKTNLISLSNILDPYGVPLTKIFWKKHPSEITSGRIILEEISKFLINEDIGRLALEEYLYDQTLQYDVISGNHQMGGTRIGKNENDSVVDKNLKVHGVENLFVTGGSVFRTSGHCHPTFTIVQLSLRLVDSIVNYSNSIKVS
tara:strand:- start:6867 stop:8312 length:1446 start_codon:yes stop_codon:yes gene_type:complete